MNALAPWRAVQGWQALALQLPRRWRPIVRIPCSHGLVTLSASSKGPNQQQPKQGKKKGREGKLAVAEPRKQSNQKIDVASSSTTPGPSPSPPAGFILNDAGQVVLVAPASKRVVTIADSETGRPLDCLIRRAFMSSSGLQCLLLNPLDTPLQFLKFVDDNEGLREISDEELEQILPTAEYALAKKRLHFVFSGYCLTARGCFCFTEDDVMDLETDYGNGLNRSITEGVEITTFQVGDSEFLVYTPFDPILFVAWKDEATGELTVADEDLMEDAAVLDAIDEEKEFQELVEEEEAMNEALSEAMNGAS